MIQYFFGISDLEFADQVGSFIRWQGLGDAGKALRFDFIDQFCTDRRRRVVQDRSRRTDIEGAHDPLPVLRREDIEPFSNVFGANQTEEDLQRLLFSIEEEGLQVIDQRGLDGFLGHFFPRRGMIAQREQELQLGIRN